MKSRITTQSLTASLWLGLTLIATAPKASSEDSWLQWRGAERNGKIAEGSAPWPDTLAEGDLKKVWGVALDKGYPSPVVTGGKVLVVETADKKEEVVRALDRKSGEEAWDARWEGAMSVPFFARKNGSWVRSSPACDGERIYVGGIRDRLVAVNLKDGSFAWHVDFMEREGTPVPAFGYSSSPLIDGGFLYTQAGCAVTKLNAKTGETVWRAMENRSSMNGSAFSSPVIGTIQGTRQLVALTRSTLAGIDLKSGEVLWQYDVKAFRGMNILTPTVIGNRIFTATYGGGAAMFEIRKSGDGLAVEKVWATKTDGYMSSPVVIGDHIYLHARDQKLHCIVAETGEEAWVSGEKFGDYWSMVVNGDKVLALDSGGELILFKADPGEFKELGRVKVGSGNPTWAHLAVCGEEIFVRDLEGMTVYRWGK